MSSLKENSVGFVGLGLMGLPMCRNLIKAGLNVVATTRSPGPLKTVADEGARTVSSPREVAENASIVIMMLADTAAVEAVLTGTDGIFAGIRPDSLIIDMGTTAVTATRKFAALVGAPGGTFVDAPVSGGTGGAENGSLTIMAGGEPQAIERARPVLEILGARLTHVGPVGTGQVAKAANQVIVGLTIGAVAEALMLAAHAGADPARVRAALAGGFADSRILEVHGQRMIDRAFAPGGKAVTQRKDLSQALGLADEVDIEMPATSLNMALYDQLIEGGDGGLDHSALIKVLDPDWTAECD
ncbi:MAG: NAD(P)-dependent oxidoreductase [Rhodospirillales bacterium]|nr:NAD(P)-dependent oxidoreductase [Rhodospirillales bacterium]